jgi:enoyl-CoA hydratase/carnithine racemase
MTTATETARTLAAKPAGALQASKRLMKAPIREQIKAAIKAELAEFSVHVRSDDAKEAFRAFLEKRPPNFNSISKSPAAA